MNGRGQEDTHRAVERVARGSYGRLVAYLASRTRDVASAEDALGDALIAALTAWPREGVPHNPEGWLMTAARHFLIDVGRHERVALATEPTLMLLRENSHEDPFSETFPDERLKLLFVCAHPAIDPSARTPLMLQTVLGLDAARIARAFLVSPPTMSQRLVRAKTKIRDGGIRFQIPHDRELPQRLDAVLEAIYAAFGIGWDDMGVDRRGKNLTEEATWLARVLLQLMPHEPEVLGLLALMLHCEARRLARRSVDGWYVPLSEQDPRQWSFEFVEEAERYLAAASRHGRVGRFQLEASIQSVHSDRARSGQTEWVPIVRFYEQLLAICPTLGTRTGYAASVAEVNGPEAGLAVLDAIETGAASGFQAFWAVRAHLLQKVGRTREAMDAIDRAIHLTEDPAVQHFLVHKKGEFRARPVEMDASQSSHY